MKYDVKNDEGVVLATFTNAVQAWAYDVAVDFMNRTHEEALLCSEIVEEMWLKDDGGTPVGELCDYVAKHFKRLNEMPRREKLEDFYDNYESEDYEEYCPHGGDEKDCSSCVYNADYEWSEEVEDCVRREDEENEDN